MNHLITIIFSLSITAYVLQAVLTIIDSGILITLQSLPK